MARPYFARFRLDGISAEQYAKVNANSTSEAKQIIERQHGKVKIWLHPPNPAPHGKSQPSWYKG